MLLWLFLWGLLLAAQFILAAQPLSSNAQLILSAALLLTLIILSKLPRTMFLRLLFIGTASFMVLRYLVWRTLYTIPPVEDVFSFLPGMTLYAAELYAILMFFISIFVISDPLRRRRVSLGA